MHFAFDDDQLAFRDAVRDLLAKECPPEVVRAAWPEGPDEHGARKGDGARADPPRIERVWVALAEMGVLGMAVPQAHGGLGLTEVDWVLLAEETGFAALPHPFVETVCVAGPLLAAAGDPDGLVPGIVAGTATVGVVPLDDLVAWGDRVDRVVLLDQRTSGRHWQARRVEGGLTRGPKPGTPRRIEAALDGARAPLVLQQWKEVGRCGTPDDAALAFDRGALGTAAQLVGLGRRMLDLTVGYVSERRQFGVPVGSQQAVKHHLADAALQLTFAAPAVYRAAWSLATGAPEAARDASMAKAMASDAARLVGRKALQCHGAIGYTVEYDLHLYLKRAEALARAWGSAGWHRNRVATALGI
ncbi:MAG: acyl-CoA dehydrogenase domain protein [Acidimicrobiales bacterium]|nr:acyl-CoA dehydrogenase domain protein [Acidimicrobiales bacterium]